MVTVPSLAIIDPGSQKVQRESENLYFRTSFTFELILLHLKTHRRGKSIGRPAPVPNPLRVFRCDNNGASATLKCVRDRVEILLHFLGSGVNYNRTCTMIDPPSWLVGRIERNVLYCIVQFYSVAAQCSLCLVINGACCSEHRGGGSVGARASCSWHLLVGLERLLAL